FVVVPRVDVHDRRTCTPALYRGVRDRLRRHRAVRRACPWRTAAGDGGGDDQRLHHSPPAPVIARGVDRVLSITYDDARWYHDRAHGQESRLQREENAASR